MDRRKSIKALIIGTASAGVMLDACQPETAKPNQAAAPAADADRMAEEIAQQRKLDQETFFTPAEMATISLLADIIIPRDAVSMSASEAGVPAFIEFMAKDQPAHQVPLRGGLRWLEMESLKRFGRSFAGCSEKERLQIVEDIAYPDQAAPAMRQGAAFFSLMRNLTASGFYTSPAGVKDIGYAGNQPNQWNGVPDEVLQQYGLAYTEKEQRECIRFDAPGA